jgi:hypothetical protein
VRERSLLNEAKPWKMFSLHRMSVKKRPYFGDILQNYVRRILNFAL